MRTIVFSLLLALAGSGSATAGTIFSTFNASSDLTGSGNGLNQNFDLALKFVAGTTETLTSADVGLSRDPNTGSFPGNNFTLNIYSHNAGADEPDALLGSADLSNQATTAATVVSTTFGTGVALTSGVTYWVSVAAGSQSKGSWDHATGAGSTNYKFLDNGGPGWGSSSSSDTFGVRLTGSAEAEVPEPASLALIALAAIPAIGRRRR